MAGWTGEWHFLHRQGELPDADSGFPEGEYQNRSNISPGGTEQ